MFSLRIMVQADYFRVGFNPRNVYSCGEYSVLYIFSELVFSNPTIAWMICSKVNCIYSCVLLWGDVSRRMSRETDRRNNSCWHQAAHLFLACRHMREQHAAAVCTECVLPSVCVVVFDRDDLICIKLLMPWLYRKFCHVLYPSLLSTLPLESVRWGLSHWYALPGVC